MINHYENHIKSLKAFNSDTNDRFFKSVDFCIRKCEYHLMLLKGDYRHLFSKKYKDIAPLFFSKSSKKEKFRMRILSVFPFLVKIRHK